MNNSARSLFPVEIDHGAHLGFRFENGFDDDLSAKTIVLNPVRYLFGLIDFDKIAVKRSLGIILC